MKKVNLKISFALCLAGLNLPAQVPNSVVLLRGNEMEIVQEVNKTTVDYPYSKYAPFEVIVTGKKTKLEYVLSKYLQFNSVSGQEKVAGDWLKGICLENGLYVTDMGNQNGNYNFAASIFPLSHNLPNIVFLNHIDVVHQGNEENWDYPPFSGKVTDVEVWGRGAVDNKGVAIMQLAAILQAKRSIDFESSGFNVTFLAVSCEETQCNGGAKYVVENYLNDLNPIVVIGEGSTELSQLIDMEIEGPVFGVALANKRALWLKLDLEVESSGHGSVSPLTYANKEMVAALNRIVSKKQKAIYTDLNVQMLKDLGQLLGGMQGFVVSHPRLFRPVVVPSIRKEPVMFSLFSNTITLTGIDSDNETINAIPGSVSAMLDCRLLPKQPTDEFLESLKAKLGNENIEITILTETPRIKPTEYASTFFECLAGAIESNYEQPRVIPLCLPNINDVSYFQSYGVPSYSIIPVCLTKAHVESIHCLNERIPIKCLEKGQATYYSFIEECMDRREEILNEGKMNSVLIAGQ